MSEAGNIVDTTTEPSTAAATTVSTSTATNFRPPSSSPATAEFKAAGSQWISGSWHVTHSSLPMWKSNRNVKITYTLMANEPDTFDNLVEYQPLTSDKLKTVAGIERPDAEIPAAWNWRGKGWLKIASSHWELLGWGEEDGGWMVIYFQKTLFTPAGIDILTRQKSGVDENTLQQIRGQIKTVQDADFAKIAEEMFEVKRDL